MYVLTSLTFMPVVNGVVLGNASVCVWTTLIGEVRLACMHGYSGVYVGLYVWI